MSTFTQRPVQRLAKTVVRVAIVGIVLSIHSTLYASLAAIGACLVLFAAGEEEWLP